MTLMFAQFVYFLVNFGAMGAALEMKWKFYLKILLYNIELEAV